MTKIIWTYWHQGWDNAPTMVKQCLRSWIKLNPDYDVRALDQRSLFEHVSFPEKIDITRRDLTVQKIAVLARLALLAKHGGVWADATVACTKPLGEWLGPYYQSRFFAFRSPGVDRLMSNWFIAAETDSLILHRLYENFANVYAQNFFVNQDTPLGNKYLQRYSARWNGEVRTTVKWHSRFARTVLRVYPYFIFHYTFNKLILTDPTCADSWNQAKPFSAEPPHRLQVLEKSANGIEQAKAEIDSGSTPMYKLNWRVDSANAYWSAVLPHLEARTG